MPYAATETADGRTTYLHLFRVPNARELRLPAPADGRRYAGARLLNADCTLALRQAPDSLRLTLPEGIWWESLDCIIALG